MIEFNKSYSLIDNKITDKEPVGYCYCDAIKVMSKAYIANPTIVCIKIKGIFVHSLSRTKNTSILYSKSKKKMMQHYTKGLNPCDFGNMIDCRTYKDIERRIQNRRRTKEDEMQY